MPNLRRQQPTPRWLLACLITLVCDASGLAASAQQLSQQQIQIISGTAASICNTIKETKGQKTDNQIAGDVGDKLSGLVGELAETGGSGKVLLTHEEFEGLSRDATAAALQGDRACRERLFNKMLDKLGANVVPRFDLDEPAIQKEIYSDLSGYLDTLPPEQRANAQQMISRNFSKYLDNYEHYLDGLMPQQRLQAQTEYSASIRKYIDALSPAQRSTIRDQVYKHFS